MRYKFNRIQKKGSEVRRTEDDQGQKKEVNECVCRCQISDVCRKAKGKSRYLETYVKTEGKQVVPNKEVGEADARSSPLQGKQTEQESRKAVMRNRPCRTKRLLT